MSLKSFTEIRKTIAMRALALSLFLQCAAVLPSAAEFLQSPAEQCKTKLYAELDRLWLPQLEKALERISLSKEAKADYKKIKSGLLNDIKYFGVFDPRSKETLIAGEVFQAIKTKADLIQDLMAFYPGKLAAEGSKKAYDFYKLIKYTKKAHSAVQKGVLYTIGKGIIDLNPVTKLISNLALNIKGAVEVPDKQKQFADEMKKQLSRLDRQIAKAEKNIQAARNDTEQYDKIRAAVERYCNENPETSKKTMEDEDLKKAEAEARLMDDMLEQKRDEDQARTVEQMIDAKKAGDKNRIAEQHDENDGSQALNALGSFLEGFASGLSGLNQGASPAGVSGGGNAQCAQIKAQIDINRNTLNAFRGDQQRADVRAVRNSLNQNIAAYNQYCR